jgi:phospholipid-binding lipoprotein MlaA
MTLLMVVATLGVLAGCATSRQANLASVQETLERHGQYSALELGGAGVAPAALNSDTALTPNDPFDDPLDDPLDDPFDDPLDDPINDDWDWEDEYNGEFYTVADPLEPFNRAMFVVNDRLYFWVLKPVAQGYRTVVPRPARSGVRNFFYNLGAPIRIVNNVLQGNVQAAEAEVARFLYNSTVGVLGFGNPARGNPGLNPENVDLGQTLGRYGFDDGFYLVWPVLGPSTLRDSIGMFGDYWLRPLSYLDHFEVNLALSGVQIINDTSFRIGDYEAVKEAAIDPYQAFRDGYIQIRQSKIRR